jgi:hypothetical protein
VTIKVSVFEICEWIIPIAYFNELFAMTNVLRFLSLKANKTI